MLIAAVANAGKLAIFIVALWLLAQPASIYFNFSLYAVLDGSIWPLG
jgi:hypothetical protein